MAIFEKVGTNDNARNNAFVVYSHRLEVPDGLYFVGRQVTITYINGATRNSFTATFAGYETSTNYPVFYFDTARYRGITQRGGAIIGLGSGEQSFTVYQFGAGDLITDGLIGIGVDTPDDYLESVTFPDWARRRPEGEETDELTSQNRQVRVDSGVYTVGQRVTLSVLSSDGSVNQTIEADFLGYDRETGDPIFDPTNSNRQILLPSEKTTASPAIYTVPQSDIVAETLGIGVPTPGITASFADYGLRDGTTNTYDSQGREIVIEKGAYQAGDSVRAWIVLARDENGDVSHVEHAFEATVVGHQRSTGNLLLDPPSDVLSGTRIVAAGDKAATYTVFPGSGLVTDAPRGVGFAHFADFGLRVPGQEVTYNSQDRGIEVEHGTHNVGDMVEIRIVDRRNGQAREVEDTFEATFRGYDRATGGPIFEPPSDVRSGRWILGVAGTRENTYSVDIVTETRPVGGTTMFSGRGFRNAGSTGNFTVISGSNAPVEFAQGFYEMDDQFQVTDGNGGTSFARFHGYEESTGYPIYRTGSTEYIALNEPSGSNTYTVGNIITDMPYITCFAPGTLIATPDGESAVETLKPGDAVLTADGGVETVRFVGMQRVPTLFGPREVTHPVRILAGALGRKVPHTDLVVTKDHGMIIDGVICNAGALINGTSIVEVPTSELDTDPSGIATYYHVETESHTVLLANGAVAESFIDNVDRAVFGNHGEFVAMYGADVPAMTEMETPRAMSMRQVPQRISQRLARRATTNPVLVVRRAWRQARDWARSSGDRLARGLNTAWHGARTPPGMGPGHRLARGLARGGARDV